MLTGGEQGLRQRRAIFKTVNQFTVMRLRNRLRILLFYGVNGHLLRSPGRKAGILAEWMRKANDCSQISLIKAST
jgi:hypothetical protein